MSKSKTQRKNSLKPVLYLQLLKQIETATIVKIRPFWWHFIISHQLQNGQELGAATFKGSSSKNQMKSLLPPFLPAFPAHPFSDLEKKTPNPATVGFSVLTQHNKGQHCLSGPGLVQSQRKLAAIDEYRLIREEED